MYKYNEIMSKTISDDVNIDYYNIIGEVNIDHLCLLKLPSFLSDVKILRAPTLKQPFAANGCFNCSYNYLTSLEGSPIFVDNTFNCKGNQLSNLKGATQYIGGNFDCRENRLKSLEGIPKIIKGDFLLDQDLIDKFNLQYIYSLSDIQGRITSGFFFY